MTDHRPRNIAIAPNGVALCSCGYPSKQHRPKHRPDAWPVCSCGAEAIRHRVRHKLSHGTHCECGIPNAQHLVKAPREKGRRYTHDYVGIDGEGIGRFPHRYVLLAMGNENGSNWYVENENGLSTKECLDFILNTPNSRLFAFAFGYDLTKILQDIDSETLYKLFRPSLRYRSERHRHKGPRPVQWGDYTLNWLNGKFTVRLGKKHRSIWDIYKFFQCSFVKALETWQIGDTEFIAAMKERRGEFKLTELDTIRSYCFQECTYLAKLARRLITAHNRADLNLQNYFGPGSTASVALKKMGIRDIRGTQPQAMQTPVACGFFGGRFEHSVMGAVKTPVYGYDISSAYPYQLYQLPCLMCGDWYLTTKESDLASATTALIHYRYRGRVNDRWAPFPVRDVKGNICYPYRGEGWTWMPEWKAASRLFPNQSIQFHRAWVYETRCNCQPFGAVPSYYRRRVELGKDGAGIVLKLAINSIYGKLAQSTGLAPPFQSWVWAGLVTSGTRAMILDAMGRARRKGDILAIATDGIYSRTPLDLPKPIDTGTSDLSKPLGGWEAKCYQDGMFFVKPGIYFPLGDSEVDLRARGIGRRALVENRAKIVAAWNAGDTEIVLNGIPRFFGAKTTISPKLKRSPLYGEWRDIALKVAFTCPNRNPDMSLKAADYMSAPYDKSLDGPEKLMALVDEAIEYEQPQ